MVDAVEESCLVGETNDQGVSQQTVLAPARKRGDPIPEEGNEYGQELIRGTVAPFLPYRPKTIPAPKRQRGTFPRLRLGKIR